MREIPLVSMSKRMLSVVSIWIGVYLGLFLVACSAYPAQQPSPEVIDPGIDPQSWQAIPGGEFLFGQHLDEVVIEQPYEMMVTDVTNAQFAQYLNEALAAGSIKMTDEAITGYYPGDEFHAKKHEVEITPGDYVHVPLKDPALRFTWDGSAFTVMQGYENHPVTLVSWFGAKAYCEFYGWRLPSDVEWERAARGVDGRAYPWGKELQRENANFYSSHDIFEKIAGGLGDTTPVGYYNGKAYEGYQTLDSPSPEGLYDMAGNVWQWLADVTEGTHYRLMAGGSRADYGYNLRVWTRNSAGPDYASSSVGFRCVR
jgi:formylglycine-generating enzyme